MARFCFKQFSVENSASAQKVGTDGVLLGAWAGGAPAASYGTPARILDVGTGTGVIALMAAQRWGDAEITGIDIDAPSVEEAAANFAASPWNTRLKALKADFITFKDGAGYDLIISNPPFFSGQLRAPGERRSAARHADTLPHEALFASAKRLLRENGTLALVFPAEAERELILIGDRYDLFPVRICRVAAKWGKGAKRVLMEFSGIRKEPLEEELCILGPDGEFSPEYKSLTGAFYLKF